MVALFKIKVINGALWEISHKEAERNHFKPSRAKKGESLKLV